MFGIGGPELAVILVVALIFVGPEKLPKVARSVGTGLRDLRRVANLAQAELKETVDDLIREADIEDEAYEREQAARKNKETATADAPPTTPDDASSARAADSEERPTPAGRAPDPASPTDVATTTVGAGPQVAAAAAAAAASAEAPASDAPRDFADLFVEKANAWQAESGWQADDAEPSSGAATDTSWTSNESGAPFEMDLPGVRMDGPPPGVSGTHARRSSPVRAGSAAAAADQAAAEAAAVETAAHTSDPSAQKEGPA